MGGEGKREMKRQGRLVKNGEDRKGSRGKGGQRERRANQGEDRGASREREDRETEG